METADQDLAKVKKAEDREIKSINGCNI